MPRPVLTPRSREWRFQNLVIPLSVPEPASPSTSAEAYSKPLSEVAYLVVRGLQEKQQIPLLVTTLTNLMSDLQSKPGKCITEEDLKDTFKMVAVQVLPPSEMEIIFPLPDAAKKVSRKLQGRRSRTRSKQSLSQSSSLAENVIPQA